MDAIDYVRDDILEIKKEHTLLIEKMQKTFELFHDDIKKTREQQNLIVQNLTEKGNDIQFLAAQFQYYKKERDENTLSIYHNKQDIVDLKEVVGLLNDDIKDVQDGLNSLDSQMRNYSIDVANSHGSFLKKSDEIAKNLRETQDALKSHIEFTKEELTEINIRMSDGYAKLAVKIEELEGRVDVHSHFCTEHQFMLRKIYPFECHKCGKEVKNPTNTLLSFPPKYECEPSCDRKAKFKVGDFWETNHGEIIKIAKITLGGHLYCECVEGHLYFDCEGNTVICNSNKKIIKKLDIIDWPSEEENTDPKSNTPSFSLYIDEYLRPKAYYNDNLSIYSQPNLPENPEFKIGQVWEFYNEPTENHNTIINNGDKLLILSMKENTDAIIVTLQNSETTHLIMKNNLKYYCSNQSLDDFPLIPNPNYKS